MKWDEKWEARALRRIATLLFALAHVAERAGSMPLPVRIVVLAVLRHAEAVVWAFFSGTARVPTACGPNDRPQQVAPAGAPAEDHHGPADAARLAISLRALALIVAHWAIEALSSTAAAPSLRRAVAPNRAHPGGSWRGPGALPAPDT
jgi:hypothetical protein